MRFTLALLLYGAVTLSLPALAQRSAATPNPVDGSALVPDLKYDSAFAGYSPYREEKLAPWREVNDEVGRVGGHMGIFSGAQGGQSAAQSSGPEAGRAHQPEHK